MSSTLKDICKIQKSVESGQIGQQFLGCIWTTLTIAVGGA
jgi:hypothetical protein